MSHTSFARLLPLVALAALVRCPPVGATPAHGASFTVNATHDAVDAAPGDGVCADAGGACTLRAAVMETNGLPFADDISLPPGTYLLSIPGSGEDASATGDMDITGALSIAGTDATTTVIDAGELDRVFHVLALGSMHINDMTIQNGLNANGFGGGIYNVDGGVMVTGTIIRGNTGLAGGGLFNSGYQMTLQSSTIIGNTATNGGGAANSAGGMTLLNTTVSQNTAALGGGIFSNSVNTLGVRDSIVSSNLSQRQWRWRVPYRFWAVHNR